MNYSPNARRACAPRAEDHDTNAPDAPGVGDLGRLGGDEFVVILPQVSSRAAAAATADSIISVLHDPIEIGDHEIVMTPSIGIALSPEDGTDAGTLLHNADLAMYFSKRRAHGTHAFFDSSMSDGALRRMTVEGKLRGALERNELSLHYQPQFELATGELSGLEALLRWTNPDLGPVPVLEFIEIAEDTGLIVPIGDWVLRNACNQARHWRDQGLPFGHISVNVSGVQFLRRDFPETVAEAIKEAGIEPQLIELEITETVVMRDEAWSEKALASLRAVGVSLAIDDFGIGYSSLGRLRNLAVDRLKVDRSFVSNLETGVRDRSIASAIIKMSRTLGITVVAEGVETFNQMLYLQEQQCETAQGYLFSRPLADCRCRGAAAPCGPAHRTHTHRKTKAPHRGIASVAARACAAPLRSRSGRGRRGSDGGRPTRSVFHVGDQQRRQR